MNPALKYKRTDFYWKVWMARLAFVVVFEVSSVEKLFNFGIVNRNFIIWGKCHFLFLERGRCLCHVLALADPWHSEEASGSNPSGDVFDQRNNHQARDAKGTGDFRWGQHSLESNFRREGARAGSMFHGKQFAKAKYQTGHAGREESAHRWSDGLTRCYLLYKHIERKQTIALGTIFS